MTDCVFDMENNICGFWHWHYGATVKSDRSCIPGMFGHQACQKAKVAAAHEALSNHPSHAEQQAKEKQEQQRSYPCDATRCLNRGEYPKCEDYGCSANDPCYRLDRRSGKDRRGVQPLHHGTPQEIQAHLGCPVEKGHWRYLKHDRRKSRGRRSDD